MTLGEVMQAASAFTIVQSAFNWLVDNYPRLADWTASARRVASLMVALDDLEQAESAEGFERIQRRRDGDRGRPAAARPIGDPRTTAPRSSTIRTSTSSQENEC